MARVVISEFMDQCAVAELSAAGHDVVFEPALVDDHAALVARFAEADAVIVRNRTQVRGPLLAAMGKCRVVGRLGVGLDNIDVAECERRGIVVVPATGANALSVAEYVITAALMLRRGAFLSSDAVARGEWPRAALVDGREIAGSVLGLIGFGSIGQLTAERARGLGMRVIATTASMDQSRPELAALGVSLVSLEELVAASDVVSLHAPLSDSTRGLFDATQIAAMKSGAILINTARGEMVDDVALADALRRGHLGGAALDVFAPEPLTAGGPLDGCPNLLLTPHIGGVTAQSNARVSSMIAERVVELLAD